MYHSKNIDEVFSEFKTSKDGLSQIEAKKRFNKYGPNELRQKNKTSPWLIFFRQFNSFIVYILIAASLVSFLLGEKVDAIVIFVILVMIGFTGFVQEYKAEKAIDALKKLASFKAKVLRKGKKELIDAKDLVPGDIILLETGDKISADARLIEEVELTTLESSLTGESIPIEKDVGVLSPKTILAERKNMVYSGTVVTNGHGLAIVTSTGMDTQIGKIAKMIDDVEVLKTPLQTKLANLGRWLGILTLIICAIVTLTGILKGGSLLEMFILGVSLAVAAIPEGLPAVVTISLAIGVQAMVKKNALIRKLPSVETLGSTTVICSDKTGTLTCNQMTVKRLYLDKRIIDVTGNGYSADGEFYHDEKKVDAKGISFLLEIGALNNDSSIEKDNVIGDPTEAALLISAKKAGIDIDTLIKKSKRITEIPFTSERKIMTTVNDFKGEKLAFMKGAPEIVIDKCSRYLDNGRIKKLTPKDKKDILSVNKDFANKALRVLGFAYKPVTDAIKEEGFIFVGLQAMIDPPRSDVKDAIKRCYAAGIKVIMITGDNDITAKAIAHELGIEGDSLRGEELDKLDLETVVEDISIYARVNPEHKIKIVSALKDKGHIVAMTGDGVNDAPALKKSDIGIAMGITGTDVSKEASEMILTDDNFSSIVNAIEEGRGIYNNIKKFVNYLLSCNFGEVLLLFVAMLIGFKDPHTGSIVIPLAAIQILWMNLITDGLPALALGVDPVDPGVMKNKPRDPKKHIISKNMFYNILAIGVVMTLATLYVFHKNLAVSASLAQTTAFTTLVILEIVRVYMVRLQYHSGIFSNKWLIGALASSFLLQLLVIYTPLNVIFKTTPLGIMQWLDITIVSVGALFIGLVLSHFIHIITNEDD